MPPVHPETRELPTGATDADRMRLLVDELSEYIEYFHSGSVEMVSFDGETLKVRFFGACAGCPISSGTLHGWIEGNVRQFFPNLEKVEAVDE
jgi:Fe-S cluster biogenesis protein NfuA